MLRSVSKLSARSMSVCQLQNNDSMKTSLLVLAVAFLPVACAQSGGKLSSAQKDKLRKHFDKDGDGKLNAEERAAARKAISDRLDRNGDGKVDANERAAAKARMQ